MRTREPGKGVCLVAVIVAGACLSSGATAAERGRKKKDSGGESETKKVRAPNPRTVRMCTDAYATGRRLEMTARLREAKEAMMTCAQPACSGVRHGFLRHDCLFRFSRIESDIPTVIPVVLNEAGEPMVDVQVSMDGTLLSARTEGLAFSIDPGLHEFVFKREGTVLARRSIVVLQGQQNRALTIDLRGDRARPAEATGTEGPVTPIAARDTPADDQKTGAAKTKQAVDESDDDAPHPASKSRWSKRRARESDGDTLTEEIPARPPEGRHLTFGSVSFGLIGLAGAGGFGLLTYWGRLDNTQLSKCAPNCPQASVDRVSKLYRAANISLGVGGGALLLATLIYANSADSPREQERPRRTALRLDVAPSSAGAVASVSGRF